MNKKLLITISVLMGSLSGLTFASDTELSPAEQAALALKKETSAEHFKKMCLYTLLNADEATKNELISNLAGKTCAEAAEEAVANTTLADDT